MSGQQPRRVRVTSPRRSAPRIGTRHVVSREIDESTGVGEVYMRSLIGIQLRLGLVVCAALAVTLGALPLLFALDPGLADLRVLGLPLFWLLLGVVVYPLLVLAGWWYVRAAERNERDFVELARER